MLSYHASNIINGQFQNDFTSEMNKNRFQPHPFWPRWTTTVAVLFASRPLTQTRYVSSSHQQGNIPVRYYGLLSYLSRIHTGPPGCHEHAPTRVGAESCQTPVRSTGFLVETSNTGKQNTRDNTISAPMGTAHSSGMGFAGFRKQCGQNAFASKQLSSCPFLGQSPTQ